MDEANKSGYSDCNSCHVHAVRDSCRDTRRADTRYSVPSRAKRRRWTGLPPCHLAVGQIAIVQCMTDTTPYYGLPEKVRFCRSCVVSNQRPNSTVEFTHTRNSKKAVINFDAEGVCDACRFALRKQQTTDWKSRESQLKELAERYYGDGISYNCLVPGSGGKDSFFQSHVLKHKFGFRPLTVTWAPHIYTPWGWRNHQNWIHSGFDNYLVTPNGLVHRLLTRLAVERLFHPFQPCGELV